MATNFNRSGNSRNQQNSQNPQNLNNSQIPNSNFELSRHQLYLLELYNFKSLFTNKNLFDL